MNKSIYLTLSIIFTFALSSSTIFSAIIVSNRLETEGGNAGVKLGFWRATSFTTGSNLSGYSLANITGHFSLASGSPADFEARIYTDIGSEPGTVLEALTGNDPTTDAAHTFNSTGLLLSANTTYWMAYTSTENVLFNNSFRANFTSSPNQTSADGWTIGNDMLTTTDQSGNWTKSEGLSLQFSVDATPVPESKIHTSISCLISLTGVFLLKFRKLKEI